MGRVCGVKYPRTRPFLSTKNFPKFHCTRLTRCARFSQRNTCDAALPFTLHFSKTVPLKPRFCANAQIDFELPLSWNKN